MCLLSLACFSLSYTVSSPSWTACYRHWGLRLNLYRTDFQKCSLWLTPEYSTQLKIYILICLFLGGGGGGGCSRYISSSTKYYAHKCTHVIVLSKTGIFYLTGPWTLWFCCCLCGVRKPSEFIKNIFICVLKMNKVSYRFGMTWGWQNDRIFIFGELTPYMHLHCNYRKHKHINFINNTKKY